MKDELLTEEALKVIDQSSRMVGKYRDDIFNRDIWNDCRELGMESPIEHILYIAFKAVQVLIDSQEVEITCVDGEYLDLGLGIFPQYKVGRYRADFIAVFGKFIKNNHHGKQVIVECDSQQFHERTEKERRYEKARDRFFQIKGYKVFRYTGKEIMKDPYVIACEIIAYLIDDNKNDLYSIVKEFKE